MLKRGAMSDQPQANPYKHLQDLQRLDLLVIARRLGIPRFRKLTKADLIREIPLHDDAMSCACRDVTPRDRAKEWVLYWYKRIGLGVFLSIAFFIYQTNVPGTMRLTDEQREEFVEQIAHGEDERTKKAVDSALRRAAGMEPILQDLREHSDTGSLLKHLVADRDRMEHDLVQRNREIAVVAFLRGDVQTAEQAVDDTLESLPGDLDANKLKGDIQWRRGEVMMAEKSYQRVLEIAKEGLDKQWESTGYDKLGVVHYLRGDLGRAEQMFRQALEIDKRLNNEEGIAERYGHLGLIYKERGDLIGAERMQRSALGIDERLGNREGMAKRFSNLGVISGKRGDLDEAERMVRTALEINKSIEKKEGMATDYGILAAIYLGRGEPDEAERLLREALTIDEVLGNQKGMANHCANLSMIFWRRGDLDNADRMTRKVIEINRRIGNKSGMAKHFASLGLIFANCGNPNVARDLWTQAIKCYVEMGAPRKVTDIQGWLDRLPDG